MNTEKQHRVGAIIVASGESKRMRGVDKISTNLAGKPLIQWSLECFERSSHIDEIVLVLSKKNIGFARKLIRSQHWGKTKICLGGLKRQDSTKAGLHDLHHCDFVVVHDGARPCISDHVLESGITKAFEFGSAVAAVPVTDTIKSAGPFLTVLNTHDRAGLWAVQTPQIFTYEVLMRAFKAPHIKATDESTLVEAMGNLVQLYESSPKNIKVTTKQDLFLAESILLARRAPTHRV